MSKKYKMTGCARFFLVMLILAPLAYLGAAYYNGENGIDNIKNLLGIGDSPSQEEETYTGTSDDLREELQKQERTIKRLEHENADLQQKLEDAEREIQSLKDQVEGQ